MTKNFDLHQTITSQIIEAIEAGAKGGDWQLPWVGLRQGLPFNVKTGNSYRGINILLLWARGANMAYPTNEWASYKQWAARGCQVKKGEKGTMVVFTKPLVGKDDNGQPDPEKTFRMLRYYRVFNAAQVDGWESPEIEYPDVAERIEGAEDFVTNTRADIRFGQGRACYVPSKDFIMMPTFQAFRDTQASTATENAYSTLLHELTHWTGHEKRCERVFGKRFGDNAYAMEELVAELGSAFLCASLGIAKSPRKDHAQYIDNWLEVLKGDKRAIFTAAARASDAVDFLDGLQYDDGEPEALPAPVPALPAPEPVTLQEPEPVAAEAAEPGGLVRRQAVAYARWLAERDGLAEEIEFAVARPNWDGQRKRYRSVTFEDGNDRVVIAIPSHSGQQPTATAEAA